MPSTLPEGDVAPADGALPASALDEMAGRPFGVYVHVPFCTVRCGYCDFNTYTAADLGSAPGASQASYHEAAIAEVRLASRVLGHAAPPVDTVFFGGGTPTLLRPERLGAVLDAVRDRFGLADDAEVTRRLLARAALEHRSDDTAEVIAQRLALYHQVTAPILAWYRDRGILVSVDAMRSAPEVGREILVALEAMRPFLEREPAQERLPVDLTSLGEAFGATGPATSTSD